MGSTILKQYTQGNIFKFKKDPLKIKVDRTQQE